MKEMAISFVENSVENRSEKAMSEVKNLSEKIALNMGEQWELDRFGKYKSEHMERMANNSEQILSEYGLDKRDDLKEYLSIFKFICKSHDLGRHFYRNSLLDHGEIGVKLLKDSGILGNFSDNEQELVEYVIRNHSLREMEKPVSAVEEKARDFCTVFRDMDKLEVLNKRDFVQAKEIYRLLGIHFDLGEYEDEWRNTKNREEYVELIDKLLEKEDVEINDGLGKRIKEIIDCPLKENTNGGNIVELFVQKESMPLGVYKETQSYSNYLLFLLSLINSIEYQGTLNKISSDEIQKKIDFLRSRTTENQFNSIKGALANNFDIKVD